MGSKYSLDWPVFILATGIPTPAQQQGMRELPLHNNEIRKELTTSKCQQKDGNGGLTNEDIGTNPTTIVFHAIEGKIWHANWRFLPNSLLQSEHGQRLPNWTALSASCSDSRMEIGAKAGFGYFTAEGQVGKLQKFQQQSHPIINTAHAKLTDHILLAAKLRPKIPGTKNGCKTMATAKQWRESGTRPLITCGSNAGDTSAKQLWAND